MISFCRVFTSAMLRGSSPRDGQRSTLENERVSLRATFDHPAQRRVGDKPAVPIIFAIDLDRRKRRRKRAACHDMLWTDEVRRGVEISKVAGLNIDGADAQT